MLNHLFGLRLLCSDSLASKSTKPCHAMPYPSRCCWVQAQPDQEERMTAKGLQYFHMSKWDWTVLVQNHQVRHVGLKEKILPFSLGLLKGFHQLIATFFHWKMVAKNVSSLLQRFRKLNKGWLEDNVRNMIWIDLGCPYWALSKCATSLSQIRSNEQTCIIVLQCTFFDNQISTLRVPCRLA